MEGTKAVLLNSATAVITQSFEDGLGGVKKLELGDYLKGGKKRNKPKKGLWSFKKTKDETEGTSETEIEIETLVDYSKPIDKDIK